MHAHSSSPFMRHYKFFRGPVWHRLVLDPRAAGASSAACRGEAHHPQQWRLAAGEAHLALM